MKRLQKWIPAIVAAVLICISSVGDANAYFTTYVIAKGGYSWRHNESMNDEVNNWDKYVSVSSQEGSIPVYVRVKGFAGSKYTLTYTGDGWTYNSSDGYYYYNEVLEGGKTTSSIRIAISDIPSTPEDGDNFNVVVIYETIPVQYDSEGNLIAPIDADWSGEVDNE